MQKISGSLLGNRPQEADVSTFSSLAWAGEFFGKASAYNEGDPGSIPGSGRSPGEGNGNPLQYFCLGNPMRRGAGRLYSPMGLQKNWTPLSN